MPHDTPLGAFHAKTRDGGLGVPSLATEVPRWRADRLKGLTQNPLPLIQWLLGQADVQVSFKQQTEYLCAPKSDTLLRTKQNSIDYWKARLTQSVDGRGLRNASLSPESHKWVRVPTGTMRGGEYVKMLAVRFATLKTRLRASRGRVGGAVGANCYSCTDSLHSLSHISQVCGRLEGLRIQRHDSVCSVLMKAGQRRGFKCLWVPIIRTGDTLKGSLKPDLAFIKGSSVVIIDPTIVSDQANLRKEDEAKKERYDKPIVREHFERYLGHPAGGVKLHVEGLAMSWRGVVSREGWRAVSLRLGLTESTLMLIILRALVGTWKMWHYECRMRTR